MTGSHSGGVYSIDANTVLREEARSAPASGVVDMRFTASSDGVAGSGSPPPHLTQKLTPGRNIILATHLFFLFLFYISI